MSETEAATTEAMRWAQQDTSARNAYRMAQHNGLSQWTKAAQVLTIEIATLHAKGSPNQQHVVPPMVGWSLSFQSYAF